MNRGAFRRPGFIISAVAAVWLYASGAVALGLFIGAFAVLELARGHRRSTSYGPQVNEELKLLRAYRKDLKKQGVDKTLVNEMRDQVRRITQTSHDPATDLRTFREGLPPVPKKATEPTLSDRLQEELLLVNATQEEIQQLTAG